MDISSYQVLSTVQDSEVTCHQLSADVWLNVHKQDIIDRAAFSEAMGLGELDKSDIAAMDQAHHIYTYNLEVNEAVQVDIRLDFGNSQNVEVQDDENVIDENGNKIVVASIMPKSSHTIASIKAYDTDWVI